MQEKKIIAVVGATGAQGGGLARAILADGQFALRALTRKPDGEKAAALRAAGADVVEADSDSEDSVAAAFAGAYGAFCVTNYWELLSPEKELAQARNLANAAKRAGVQHVVWSTLEDTRKQIPLDDERIPTLMGHYKVPHFDAKGEADAFFAASGVPTTYLYAAFYWENFIYFGSGPKRGADGVLDFILPLGESKLAGVASEDIGRVAYGIFKAGPSQAGQRIGVAGGALTGAEYAAKLSRALGEEVRYANITPETFRSFGFPGADDLGNMFQHHAEFESEVLAMRDVERARSFNPQLLDFDQWLAQNAAKIPVEPK